MTAELRAGVLCNAENRLANETPDKQDQEHPLQTRPADVKTALDISDTTYKAMKKDGRIKLDQSLPGANLKTIYVTNYRDFPELIALAEKQLKETESRIDRRKEKA